MSSLQPSVKIPDLLNKLRETKILVEPAEAKSLQILDLAEKKPETKILQKRRKLPAGFV